VFIPVPSSVVMIANGALFGVAVGTSLSLLGSLGAAALGFLIGRRSTRLLERLVSPAEKARADELLRRGTELMQAPLLVDKERAWRDYLEPLGERFPDHPYQDEVKKLRQQLEEARRPARFFTSEAQRLYAWGEQLALEGKLVKARAVWKDLACVFKGIELEKDWVERAEDRLKQLQKGNAEEMRRQAIRAALDRAATLPRAQAEEIWSGLERLYAAEPSVQELLCEIPKARDKQK